MAFLSRSLWQEVVSGSTRCYQGKLFFEEYVTTCLKTTYFCKKIQHLEGLEMQYTRKWILHNLWV